MDHPSLLKLAVEAAIKAGEEILRIYDTDFSVETKPDHTPVTLADKASSKRILSILASSDFPVISEEETISNYPVRKHWELYWLVDPLDGTKEFIKRNGEFAVNIALIKDRKPIIGVIYGPFFKSLYFACKQKGSFKVEFAGALPVTELSTWFEDLMASAQKLPLQPLPKNYTVIASRSHLSRDINLHLERLKNIYGPVDMINAGSSIKQCWVAEGRAHEYPRFGTTMEWDTAAGQCILEEAGKHLIDLSTNEAMCYNKEQLENNFFIAKA
jgi:3'(2'), 5'-bisphosphate nucleotidase